MEAPIISLVVYGAVGVVVAMYIARRVGRFLNFRTLLVLNYVVVSIVSGIVHLSRIEGAPRGFFDVVGAGQATLVTATIGSILGLIALCAGCIWKLEATPVAKRPDLRRVDRWIVFLTLAVLAPIALNALARIQAIAAQSDSVRVLSVDQGAARFVFMSHWAVWSISFAALWLMSFKPFRGTFSSLMITLGGVALITGTLSWTGGRSIILVMVLPLLLVAGYRFRRAYWIAIPAIAIAGIAYVIALTSERTAGARTGSSVATWLDWEWGRFSMLGFASRHVQESGFLGGETFFAAFMNVALGMLRLVGIGINNPPVRAMPQITGEQILGTSDTYVVAGLNSELYVNFGYVGIVVGLGVLGLAASYVDRKFAASPNLLTQFAWGYLGTLIIFRTLAADANALGSFLLYSGAPVLLIAFLAWVTRDRQDAQPGRSARRKPAVRGGTKAYDRLVAEPAGFS